MNNKTNRPASWPEIRAALSRREATLPAPRPASSFWAEFHARRVRLVAWPGPATTAAASPFLAARRLWPAAAAVVALLSAALWLGTPGWRGERGAIRTFEVGVPHRAVLILDAPNAEASILWIEGIELNAPGGIGT